MARNYLGQGNKLTLNAPYALTSGQGALVGALFGVAQHDAAINTPVVLDMNGIYALTKEPSLAIAVGARIFWDNTNRRVTTTATGNFAIGRATVAALAADAVAAVLLSPTTAVGA